MTAVYSFIAEEKADSSCCWSVAEMCRTLGVSRQGFYDWESRPPSGNEVTDRLLAAEIEAIWESSARTYGAPRVHAWRRQGLLGVPQAGRSDHARERLGRRVGPPPGAHHHRRPRCHRGGRLGGAQLQPGRPRCDLGQRHHLHRRRGGLAVPVHRDRPVLPPGHRLGCRRSPARPARLGCARDGGRHPGRARRRGRVPLRPGLPRSTPAPSTGSSASGLG